MIDSIHAALWDWFLKCTAITKLFFNFSTAEDEATVIATAGDTLLEEYIDGSQRRRYSFELTRFCPVTFMQNDSGNIEMLEDVQAITKWVEEQNDEAKLPLLPDGMTPESIAPLDDYGGYAVALNEKTARYTVPFALDYIKTKG